MFLRRKFLSASGTLALAANDQAEELIKTQMQSLPTSSVIAVSCAAIMHSDAVPLAPTIWLLAMVGVNVIRYSLMRRYKTRAASTNSAESFLRQALFLNVMVGLIWALIPAFFTDLANPEDSILLIIVACVCAGAAVQSASYAAAASAIIIPIMTVISVKFFMIGGRNSIIMLMDVLLYFAFLIGTTQRVEALVLKMIRLNKDAAELAGSLEIEHAESLATAARLFVIANHDPLTGLANRAALAQRLALSLEAARNRDEGFFLFLLDLDHFKSINDTLGHSAGDRVLKEVAARLSTALSGDDIAARLGGDEFAIILNCPGLPPDGLMRSEHARLTADRLMATVCGPLRIGDRLVNIAASIGVAAFPMDATSAEELFANADLALYAAKDGGRQRWRRFDASLRASAKMTRDIEHDLPEALETGALQVWYQPQIALGDGRLTGLEALLRWEHPIHGWIAPPLIVMAALRTHASHQLTGFVLAKACQTIQALDDTGLPNVSVAVNISPRELDRYALPDLIKSIVDAHGIDAARLELEITEEAFAASETALATLETLSGMGMPLAIDDFGTGCSSLAYLRSMRVNRLKIDRVFITGLAEHAGDRILVQAILGIGRSFGIEVVAEGVETAEEAALLLDYGCQIVQGFYFARPMSGEDLPKWIAARTKSDANARKRKRAKTVSAHQDDRAVRLIALIQSVSRKS